MDYGYTLFDVEATIFPGGLHIPCTSIILPKGLFEDFLLYTSNTHSLFSCVFAPINSPVGAVYHTATYLVKEALTFSLASIGESLIHNLGYSHVVTEGLKISFNVLCVTPLSSMVAKFCILATSVVRSIDARDPTFKLKHPIISFLLLSLSRLSILLLSGMVLGLLVVTSLFSYHTRTITFIHIYLIQILMPAVTMELLMEILVFYPYGSICIYVLNNAVFKIGLRYCETLRKDSKIEGKDFKVTKWALLNTLICVEYVHDIQDNNDKTRIQDINKSESESGVYNESKICNTGKPRANWKIADAIAKLKMRQLQLQETGEKNEAHSIHQMTHPMTTSADSTLLTNHTIAVVNPNVNHNDTIMKANKRASLEIAAPQVCLYSSNCIYIQDMYSSMYSACHICHIVSLLTK